MGGKTDILKRLRLSMPPAVDLPAMDGPWIRYEDPRQQFCDTLAAVGGQALPAGSIQELDDALQQLPAWSEAKVISSLVPGIRRANLSLPTVDDPHQLADLDFVILPGQFAVAENAAVWVSEQGLKHRAALFIPQHLVLVVPADQIVHNMHQAYQRLTFDSPGFGAFISGPSKTADIEQSLVIGAHGARSLTVFLLDSDVSGTRDEVAGI